MVNNADQLPAFVFRHKLALDFGSTPWGQGLSKNGFLDPNTQLIFSIDSAQLFSMPRRLARSI